MCEEQEQELQALRDQLAAERRGRLLENAAPRVHCRDPEAAQVLLGDRLDRLDPEDPSAEDHAADLLRGLLAERPWLKARPTPTGSADQGARGVDTSSLSRDHLADLPPQRINQLRRDGLLDGFLDGIRP